LCWSISKTNLDKMGSLCTKVQAVRFVDLYKGVDNKCRSFQQLTPEGISLFLWFSNFGNIQQSLSSSLRTIPLLTYTKRQDIPVIEAY
jgi:hypothetical protein